MTQRLYKPDRPLKIDWREVLRYAGMKGMPNAEMYQMVQSAIDLCVKSAKPQCVYRYMQIAQIEEKCVTFENGFQLSGNLAARYLANCEGAYILLGTVGLDVDRMIKTACVRSAVDGLFADAAGSAAIEALLDNFCGTIPQEFKNKTRISPGYGDFSLENQISIFKLLDATRLLGVCLNSSLLISPSKSVTAVVGCERICHV